MGDKKMNIEMLNQISSLVRFILGGLAVGVMCLLAYLFYKFCDGVDRMDENTAQKIKADKDYFPIIFVVFFVICPAILWALLAFRII